MGQTTRYDYTPTYQEDAPSRDGEGATGDELTPTADHAQREEMEWLEAEELQYRIGLDLEHPAIPQGNTLRDTSVAAPRTPDRPLEHLATRRLADGATPKTGRPWRRTSVTIQVGQRSGTPSLAMCT